MYLINQEDVETRLDTLRINLGLPANRLHIVEPGHPIQAETPQQLDARHHDEEIITQAFCGHDNLQAARIFESIRDQLREPTLRNADAALVQQAFSR